MAGEMTALLNVDILVLQLRDVWVIERNWNCDGKTKTILARWEDEGSEGIWTILISTPIAFHPIGRVVAFECPNISLTAALAMTLELEGGLLHSPKPWFQLGPPRLAHAAEKQPSLIPSYYRQDCHAALL